MILKIKPADEDGTAFSIPIITNILGLDSENCPAGMKRDRESQPLVPNGHLILDICRA